MTHALSQRLLTFISDRRYEPTDLAGLAKALDVNEAELAPALALLVENKKAQVCGDQTIQLPEPGREVTGRFRANERGFGFIMTDQPYRHGDLFVPPDKTGGAMDGDKVRVRVHKDRWRNKQDPGKSPYLGRIVEILERCPHPQAGTLIQKGDRFYVEVDGRLIKQPVPVADPTVKGAKAGDKVVIELIEHPDGFGSPGEGVITEVLGEAGLPDVETQAVMHAFGLQEGFDDDVMAEARRMAQSFDDDEVPEGREDLTDSSKLLITTIDPPTAKDFDDAISLVKFDGDNVQKDGAVWELGVHIADVAHFVQPESALDVSAKKRGNSTYLPRRVIPMLPEVLSNGVCSLNPGVNRLAKSCFIRYSASGKVIAARFARTVIRSAKRMTYLEAQALIDDDIRGARKHAKTEPKYPRAVIQQLKMMDELAKTIRERRMKDGMIVLGLPEVELVYNDLGQVIDAEPEDDAFTHTIIEMFMVEANEAAARLFHTLGLPMIRRTHPAPESTSTQDLAMHAKNAGIKLPPNPDRKDLQRVLEATRGSDVEHAVHLAVLKTLMRAEYSPLMIGHYALASEHYTHFTSPIRRYPDLIVHRGIDAYLQASGDGKKVNKAVIKQMLDDARIMDEDALRDMGAACSGTERNSEQAEKSLRMFLVLQLMSSMVGDDFGGTITGLNNRGIFVEIDKYLIDGFIQTRELASSVGLPGERFKLDPRTNTLVGQQSGVALRIGQRLMVRIAKVDLGRRQMDLAILELEGKKARSGKGKAGKGKQGGRGQGGRAQGGGGNGSDGSGQGQGKGGKRRLMQLDPEEARELRRAKKKQRLQRKNKNASNAKPTEDQRVANEKSGEQTGGQANANGGEAANKQGQPAKKHFDRKRRKPKPGETGPAGTKKKTRRKRR